MSVSKCIVYACVSVCRLLPARVSLTCRLSKSERLAFPTRSYLYGVANSTRPARTLLLLLLRDAATCKSIAAARDVATSAAAAPSPSRSGADHAIVLSPFRFMERSAICASRQPQRNPCDGVGTLFVPGRSGRC